MEQHCQHEGDIAKLMEQVETLEDENEYLRRMVDGSNGSDGLRRSQDRIQTWIENQEKRQKKERQAQQRADSEAAFMRRLMVGLIVTNGTAIALTIIRMIWG